MFRMFTFIFCVSLVLSGCGNEPSQEIGYGEIENGVYSNQYFNMSVSAPETWIIQSQAAQKMLMETGGSLLAGEDKNVKAMLKEAEEQTVNLFSFFKHEQGTPVPFNPSIMSVAENMVNMPGVKRGSDYLYHVKSFLESGQLEYKFPSEIESKVISGISFDILPAEINAGNLVVNQEYYAARINDYVLSFILSYSSESEQAELHNILSNIEFEG